MTKALITLLSSTEWKDACCVCTFKFWINVAYLSNHLAQLPVAQAEALVLPNLPVRDRAGGGLELESLLAPFTPLRCFLWFQGRFKSGDVWDFLEVSEGSAGKMLLDYIF